MHNLIKLEELTKKLADAETLLSLFFNSSTALFCIAQIDGRFIKVNPCWTNTLGWSFEELTNKAWIDFVHPDDLADTIATAAKMVLGEKISGFMNRYRCKDGSYKVLLWSSPQFDKGLSYATAMDVTDLEIRHGKR